MYFLSFYIFKMDMSHLVTSTDDAKKIKSTHIFIIVNFVITILVIAATIGWLFYAKSKEKWPFEEYIRKSGPKGTSPVSKEFLEHLTPKT